MHNVGVGKRVKTSRWIASVFLMATAILLLTGCNGHWVERGKAIYTLDTGIYSRRAQSVAGQFGDEVLLVSGLDEPASTVQFKQLTWLTWKVDAGSAVWGSEKDKVYVMAAPENPIHAVLVHEGGCVRGLPALAVHDDKLYCFWLEKPDKIRYRFSDNGKQWSAIMTLDNPLSWINIEAIDVTGYGDGFLLVCAARQLYVVRITAGQNGRLQWDGEPREFFSYPDPAEGVSIAAQDDWILIGFAEGQDCGCYASTNGGLNFFDKRVAKYQGGECHAHRPAFAIAENYRLAAYIECSSVYYRTWDKHHDGWSARISLFDDDQVPDWIDLISVRVRTN